MADEVGWSVNRAAADTEQSNYNDVKYTVEQSLSGCEHTGYHNPRNGRTKAFEVSSEMLERDGLD